MSVDKDLFMYGLAAVTIVRDDAPHSELRIMNYEFRINS